MCYINTQCESRQLIHIECNSVESFHFGLVSFFLVCFLLYSSICEMQYQCETNRCHLYPLDPLRPPPACLASFWAIYKCCKKREKKEAKRTRCDSAYCVIIPQRASSLVLILAGETYFWLAKQDIIFSFEGFLLFILFFGSLARAAGATHVVVGAGVSFVCATWISRSMNLVCLAETNCISFSLSSLPLSPSLSL